MIYAKYGYIPPKKWEHDPKLQNKSGYTVAMLLCKNNITVPK